MHYDSFFTTLDPKCMLHIVRRRDHNVDSSDNGLLLHFTHY